MLRFRVARRVLDSGLLSSRAGTLSNAAVLWNMLARLNYEWHSEGDLQAAGIDISRIDALIKNGVLEVGAGRAVLPREVLAALQRYISADTRSGRQFEPNLPVYWFGLPYQSPLELRHSTTLGCFEVIDRLLKCNRPVTGLFPVHSPNAETDKLIQCTVAAVTESGGRIGVIGGDHRATWSLLKSVKYVSPQSRLGCITFDAHHDLYGISRNSANEKVLPSNYNISLLNSQIIDILVLVGNRDSQSDFDYAVSRGFKVFRLDSVEQLKYFKHDCRWHLSIDLDILDIQYAPGVSNPLPNGWAPEQLMREVELALVLLDTSSMSIVEVAGQCARTANEAAEVIRMIDKIVCS